MGAGCWVVALVSGKVRLQSRFVGFGASTSVHCLCFGRPLLDHVQLGCWFGVEMCWAG